MDLAPLQDADHTHTHLFDYIALFLRLLMLQKSKSPNKSGADECFFVQSEEQVKRLEGILANLSSSAALVYLTSPAELCAEQLRLEASEDAVASA